MRYIKSFLRNKYIAHHCKICFWQQAHLVCHYVHLQRQIAVFGLHLFPLLKPFLALHTLYLEYSWVIILLLRHWDWMHFDCLLYLLFNLYVFSPFQCKGSEVFAGAWWLVLPAICSFLSGKGKWGIRHTYDSLCLCGSRNLRTLWSGWMIPGIRDVSAGTA
jgi:hypothetical protein